MGHKLKEMICKELSRDLAGVDSCFVVDPTRLDGITSNQLRRDLAAAKVRMMVVKNALARRALAGLPLEPAIQLLEGTCAIAWGGESIVDIAKLLAAKVKALPKLVIKGAVMEGQALDAQAAAGLAKLPTKAELRSTLVAMAASPGRRLAAAILAPGTKIASILKGRIETLEKGEPKPAAA